MFRKKLYITAASLLIATSAYAAPTIHPGTLVSVGDMEVYLLGPGESGYTTLGYLDGGTYNEEFRYDVESDSAANWTAEHIQAVTRSLEEIQRALNITGTPKPFTIAIALNEMEPNILGGSIGSLVQSGSDASSSMTFSSGELFLRDNVWVDLPEESFDNVIMLNSNFPLYLGAANTPTSMVDFEALLTHEILHSFGVMSLVSGDGKYYWGPTTWDMNIRDIYGNSATKLTVTGANGTVYWTGSAANEVYGGQVPIQTFANLYRGGSSISHPGTSKELMSWSLSTGYGSRDMNKLLLAMYKDMGWDVNEAYYASFGPTFYRKAAEIENTEMFMSGMPYTYAMYVNGDGNEIVQAGELRALDEQSQALSIAGNGNTATIKEDMSATGTNSKTILVRGDLNTLVIDKEATVETTGTEATAVHLTGHVNRLILSGTITSDGIDNDLVRIDNPDSHRSYSYPVYSAVHIQSNAVLDGNVINTDPNSNALITFGREYGNDLTYVTDADFEFNFSNELKGNWDVELRSGTVTMANTLVLVDGATLKGNGILNGDLQADGKIAPGNSIGTLTINGDVTQGANSDLEIEFGDGGTSDKLVVSGTVTLDGSLSLVPTGYVAAGSYSFIEAGTVVGSFVSVDNYNSAILQTSVGDLGSGSFDVNRINYASLVGSFGGGLDLARTNATGDLADILNMMDLLTLEQLQTAADDLTPSIYNSITTSTIDGIQSRASFLRNKVHSESQNNRSPLWFSGYGGNTDYDTTSGSDAFEASNKGFMFGGGKRYETGFGIGAVFGVNDFDLSEDSSFSNSEGSNYDLYLHGSWVPTVNDAFYVQAVLGLGYSDFDTDRSIDFLSRTAVSDHDANHYSAYVGAGYDYKTGNWSIDSRVGLEYIYLDEDGFTETGADGASFKIDSKESDAVISSIGLNVSHSFNLEDNLIIPNIRADWFHNFSASTDQTSGSVASGADFSIDGRDGSEDALEIGVGLKVIASDLVHGYVDYQYTIAEDQDSSYLVSAGLSYKF